MKLRKGLNKPPGLKKTAPTEMPVMIKSRIVLEVK